MLTGFGLRGRIAVVLLTVAGPGSLGIGPAEWTQVQAEALMGLRFLESLNPAADLELAVYDSYDLFVGVQSAPCSGQEQCDDYGDCEAWLYDAMSLLGLPRSRAGVEALAQKARDDAGANAGYVGAFTRYPLCHFSYAEPARYYTVIGYTTSPMSIDKIHNFFAHETCHIFEACDEYKDAATGMCFPVCGTPFGELSVPNYNSECCSWKRITCLMGNNAPRYMCEYTRWQVGWNNRTMLRQVNGPSGGTGGDPFYFSFSHGARVVQVEAYGGAYVDSLHITADVPGTGLVLFSTGGRGGDPVPPLVLAPDERIVAVSGRYGGYVDSLSIHTDKRGEVFKVGGTGGVIDFRYDVLEDRELSGLVGRSGKYLDAIGVILDPRAGTPSVGTMRRSGPSGGGRAHAFEDVPPTGGAVTKVWIRHGTYVDAIWLTYDIGGTTVDGDIHGGGGGGLDTFSLGPGEFIIGFAGRYGGVIDSLIIQTNQRFSPRYGGNGGDARFEHVCWPNEELVGFFGFADSLLVSIGGIFRRLA